VGATTVYQFFRFFNREKLPVILIGGCHNALFNVSILQIILNAKNIKNTYWTPSPVPVCFSWGLCVVPYGGAIATTGCTGYGFGSINSSGFPTYSGELETGFFREIGQEGATTLGVAHSGTISRFLFNNTISMDDAFCVTIWQLFGDPSLRLGGFP
jgi:hypothetical protein